MSYPQRDGFGEVIGEVRFGTNFILLHKGLNSASGISEFVHDSGREKVCE